MSDIVEQAKAVLARRWEWVGPPYPQEVPTGVVELGDWASEELAELIAELESARAEIERMKGDCNRKDHPCGANR
jgi:hypothetical protein